MSEGVELPITDISDFRVDSHGRIYVKSGMLARIQVFDSTGAFLYGIDMWRRGGDRFSMRVSGDQLQVHSILGDRLFTFMDGREVNVEHVSDIFVLNDDAEQVVDSKGHVYRAAQWSIVAPLIWRYESNGSRELVISQPWYLWLLKTPFPTWFICFVALLIVWIRRTARPSEGTENLSASEGELTP